MPRLVALQEPLPLLGHLDQPETQGVKINKTETLKPAGIFSKREVKLKHFRLD